MICEAFRCGLRVIEIPVHYFSRGAGVSKHSKGFLQVAKTGLRMLRAIMRKRLARGVPPEKRRELAAFNPSQPAAAGAVPDQTPRMVR